MAEPAVPAQVELTVAGRAVLQVSDALPGGPPPAGLTALVEACTAADGHAPYEEHTMLTLDGVRQVPHARVEARSGARLDGCAVLSEGVDGWVVEAAVHPALRGRGLGRRLLTAAGEHVSSHGGGTVRAWVHGGGPAQARLAEAAGAVVERRLLVLERELVELPDVPRPAGVSLRMLDPADSADRDGWLAVSNAAFDGHPDNGGWSRAELDWRLDAAWSDGSRFPVAVDDQGVVAGVWTKVDPGSSDGELYVVAAHPRGQGRGLGRAVVAQALQALAAAGCHRALLYVDTANSAGLALYAWAGFAPGAEHRCLAAHLPSARMQV